MAPDRHDFHNELLKALSFDDIERFRPHLEYTALPARMVIEAAREPFTHVYFPEDGVVSVVATTFNGKTTEIGIIGREGFTGIAAALGDDQSANESFVQVTGEAWRVDVKTFRTILSQSPAPQALMLRYVHAFMIQMAQTTLANTKSRIEERLARWLLMVQDRDHGQSVDMTHEFLAMMLGTRRPGVTVTLHELESQGLIRSARGRILVIDRKGLEEVAGSFYGFAESEYRRIMGTTPTQ